MPPDLESRTHELHTQSAEEDVRGSEGEDGGGDEGEGKSHPYLRIPWTKEEGGGTGTDSRVDVSGHYILSLTTEEFATTPVDEVRTVCLSGRAGNTGSKILVRWCRYTYIFVNRTAT